MHTIHITKKTKKSWRTLLHELTNWEDITQYEWTYLPIENDDVEQAKQFSSDEKSPLVKNKYPMFEWLPGIPILDETQEEAPDMIDED